MNTQISSNTKRHLTINQNCPEITNKIVRAVQVYADDNFCGYMGDGYMTINSREYTLKGLLDARRANWKLHRGDFIYTYLKPVKMNAQARYYYNLIQEQEYRILKCWNHEMPAIYNKINEFKVKLAEVY